MITQQEDSQILQSMLKRIEVAKRECEYARVAEGHELSDKWGTDEKGVVRTYAERKSDLDAKQERLEKAFPETVSLFKVAKDPAPAGEQGD